MFLKIKNEKIIKKKLRFIYNEIKNNFLELKWYKSYDEKR